MKASSEQEGEKDWQGFGLWQLQNCQTWPCRKEWKWTSTLLNHCNLNCLLLRTAEFRGTNIAIKESDFPVWEFLLRVCDSVTPTDYSLLGSSVHWILQARILEWVAVSLSRGFFWPWDQTCVSCSAGRFFTCWAIREALEFPFTGRQGLVCYKTFKMPTLLGVSFKSLKVQVSASNSFPEGRFLKGKAENLRFLWEISRVLRRKRKEFRKGVKGWFSCYHILILGLSSSLQMDVGLYYLPKRLWETWRREL